MLSVFDDVVFLCLQESNPYACLVFYWEPLNRQVRTMPCFLSISFLAFAGLIALMDWIHITWKVLNEAEFLVHFAHVALTGVVAFLCRSALRAKWSESPSRVPVITFTHVPKAAKSVLW